MNEQNRLTVDRLRGRGLLWLGILVALSGIGAYIALFNAKILIAPWYVPILATLGAVFLLFALFRGQTVWRWGAFLLFAALAAGEWVLMLVFFATPAYTGPVKSGQPFPEFATTLADGSPFTQADLKGDQNTVMVFYRGWW
jgi:hypothetical protein